MNERPKAVELAATIQQSMDALVAELAAHERDLLPPILEMVIVGAARAGGNRQQRELYWIADEALRRTAKR